MANTHRRSDSKSILSSQRVATPRPLSTVGAPGGGEGGGNPSGWKSTVSNSLKRSTSSTQLSSFRKREEGGNTTNSKEKQNQIYFYQQYYFDDTLPVEPVINWRVDSRIRTSAIGIILALNLSTPPPDAPPSPRAKEECWIMPNHRQPNRGTETVAELLKDQYLLWCPKTSKSSKSFTIRSINDPSVDKIKTFCQQLRTYSSNNKRVILHYNGHGVPTPTENGEIWVFNREITQYIPLSLFDLQSWIQTPTLLIFDCSRGGLIIQWLETFTEQRKNEHQRAKMSQEQDEQRQTNKTQAKGNDKDYSQPLPLLMEDYYCISACASDEYLPSNPNLPGDLLTCCLTTPIQISLRWGCQRSILLNGTFIKDGVNYLQLIQNIPGNQDDRTTPLGEISWIFTAITETIAWESFSPELFQKLYREDLVIAALFRNYLLADRILRDVQCTPVTKPKLPCTHHHPLWVTWDQVVDIFLEQLPRIVNNSQPYQPSKFFEDQLSALEVWLVYRSATIPSKPRQLPIVLQALLSPTYRIRSLELFSAVLNLGVWAINLSLSLGLFHYILKLLQRSTGPSVSLLVSIWSKIIAIDHSLQIDLVKVEGHLFFIQILQNTQNSTEDRIKAAFVLSLIMNEYLPGQQACFKAKLGSICCTLLNSSDPTLRRWVLMCIGKLYEDNPEIKQALIKSHQIHELILQKIIDPVPEVRTTAIYILGLFIATGNTTENLELKIGLSLKVLTSDINPIVRKEFLLSLLHTISAYEKYFRKVVLASMKQDVLQLNENERNDVRVILQSEFGRLWRILVSLQHDPVPYIASTANRAIFFIHSLSASELLSTASSEDEHSKDIEAMYNYLMNVAAWQSPSTNSSASTERAAPLVKKDSSKSFRKHVSDFRKSSKSPIHQSSLFSEIANSDPTLLTSYDIRSRRRSDFYTQSAATTTSLLGNNVNSPNKNHNPSVVVQRYQAAKSQLFHVSSEQFYSPSPTSHENDPTSIYEQTKQWKALRQSKMLEILDDSKNEIGYNKFETQVTSLVAEPYHVSKLLVHPFYPIIISASDNDLIRVWDWKDKTKLSCFSNTNPTGTFVSSMSFVNELEESDLLMTGSSDGVIRVWRKYSEPKPLLSTAWRAHKQPENSYGLCHLWNQTHGTVLTAGEYPIMRMWDVERGVAIQDIPTGTDSCITNMTQENPSNHVVAIGGTDGAVRVFDCRTSPRSSAIKTFKEHSRPIVSLTMPDSSMKIISGSLAGDVRFFDLRSSNATFVIQAHSRSDMASLACHLYAPIIATNSGNQNHTIKVTSHEGSRLSNIKYYSKYFGQRIGAVSCLSFHRYEPLLVAGNTDGVVAVFQSTGSEKIL